MVKRLGGWTVTGWVIRGGEERGALGKLPLDGEGDDRHPHDRTNKAACGTAWSFDHCNCHHMGFLIGIPGLAKMPLFRSSTSWVIPPLESLRTRPSPTKVLREFDHIERTRRPSWRACWYSSNGLVGNMIKYLETAKNTIRELEKPGGISTPLPGPGPDLPQDPAPEPLLRQMTTLRTAAEGVAPMEGPMESAPYGLRRVDSSLLGHIALFWASVMLGEKMPEKG